MTPLQRVLAALGDGKHYTPRNGQVNVRCPVHGDEHPSLGLRETGDGRLLLRCYVGCSTRDVLDALQLDWPDLYP